MEKSMEVLKLNSGEESTSFLTRQYRFWRLVISAGTYFAIYERYRGREVGKIPYWGRAREGRAVITSYGDIKL